MGRRSDHSRDELTALILATGAVLMAEVGMTRFSAREVAKRIGYSVGTIHNVFGTYDRLVMAINTRSFGLWADYLRVRLATAGADRIAVLVEGYFGFARENVNLWTAIYDHRLPDDAALPPEDQAQRSVLTEIVLTEVARALGRAPDEKIVALARSLIATVHGHCAFAISGAWALMGGHDPEAAALARVREALAGQG
jgi:AcrR family transcriptional regulator